MRKTVLLTTENERLVRRFSDTLDIIAIGIPLPDLPAETRYWCFVDWLLPEMSGLEMCRLLRETPATSDAHITMILRKADRDARRRAISAGADDYMVGALDADRLIRRLNLDVGETMQGGSSEKMVLGDLQIDKAAYTARYQGRRIVLALNEFRLLIHFVEHPNRAFTRSNLIAMLGKSGATIDERTVDVWIGRLRRAFKRHAVPDPLRTVRSVGYALDHVESEFLEAAR